MSEPSVQDQMQALIEQEVVRGMEPYQRLGYPPEVLEELEHMLRFALATHPTAQDLLRRLCTDPVLVKSDGVDTAGVEEALKKDQGVTMDRDIGAIPPTLNAQQHALWASEPGVPREAVDAVVAELGPGVPDEWLLSVAVHGTLEAAASFDTGRGVEYRQWAFYYAALRVWEQLRQGYRGDKPMMARIIKAMTRFNAHHKHVVDVWKDTRETDRAALCGFTDALLFTGAMAISPRGIAARGEPDVTEAEWARATGDALRKVIGELRPEQRVLMERCAAYGEHVKHFAQEANRRYNTVLQEFHETKALCGARLGALGVQPGAAWHPAFSGEVFDDPPEPANEGGRGG